MDGSEDAYAMWDAAYVLGSLSPAERREYEHHLTGCAACQRAVAELSGMPGLLSLAQDATAEQEVSGSDVPTPLYAGLAASVARRRRWFAMAAAAAALVLAGTTAAVTTAVVGSGDHPAVSSNAISSSAASSVVPVNFGATANGWLSATGTLSSYPWGTQISWRCSYGTRPSLYAGSTATQDYALVLVPRTGAQVTLASWSAAPSSTVTPTATTSIPVGQIGQLQIRDSTTGATVLSAAP